MIGLGLIDVADSILSSAVSAEPLVRVLALLRELFRLLRYDVPVRQCLLEGRAGAACLERRASHAAKRDQGGLCAPVGAGRPQASSRCAGGGRTFAGQRPLRVTFILDRKCSGPSHPDPACPAREDANSGAP